MIDLATVDIGFEFPALEVTISRADLIKYAGASGDFNVIHWNDRVAQGVGLPGVIAHGMFTMGAAIRVITQHLGDPAALKDYSCRFTRPVPVPDDNGGATVHVSAKVTSVTDSEITVSVQAQCDGATVLGKAIAVLRKPPVKD